MQPMTAAIIELQVLSKPYFDRDGLIVALDDSLDDDRPVGFAHASFASDSDGLDIDHTSGVISICQVSHRDDRDEIFAALLSHCEEYLRKAGATSIRVGGETAHAPFYRGLYGGSELAGLLLSDQATLDQFLRNGYHEVSRKVVLQRELVGFRPLVDRTQMQIRRSYHIGTEDYPGVKSWWDACVIWHGERIQFQLQNKKEATACGEVMYWDLEPLASSWGVHAHGLTHITIDASQARQGLGAFLLGESLRQLSANGITLVETQVERTQSEAIGLFTKLGFHQVDECVGLKKNLTTS